MLGNLALYAGRSREATELFVRAARAEAGGRRALASLGAARALLLMSGQAELALDHVETAQREAGHLDLAQEALYWKARCLAGAGRRDEANTALLELRRETAGWPVPWAHRLTVLLGADLALARGDNEAAAREYAEAEGLLPALKRSGPFKPDFVLIRYGLGEALFALGRDEEAARRFTYVTTAGTTRSRLPMHYVRSFYFLARIAERQGDKAAARKNYERFVGYWKDGDTDRERVAEAQRKLKSL
jgi:tetratricopeptide (TPR) repeat protein